MQSTNFLEIPVIIPLVLLSYFFGKIFIILRSSVGHIIPCWDCCLSNEPIFIGQEMIEGTRNIWPLNLVLVVLQGWQAWFSVGEWQNLWPIRLFCSVDSRFFLSESFMIYCCMNWKCSIHSFRNLLLQWQGIPSLLQKMNLFSLSCSCMATILI